MGFGCTKVCPVYDLSAAGVLEQMQCSSIQLYTMDHHVTVPEGWASLKETSNTFEKMLWCEWLYSLINRPILVSVCYC